jgi:nucleoside triphosphate diphosphatase
VGEVDRLLEIMARLRDPRGGCAWDLEQNFASIAPYTIEEAYEVDDAIRRGDFAQLRDELGDLLLQVVFHAQMAREAGHFDFGDVVRAICDKLVRRHPNVFADAVALTAQAQTDAWERQKSAERAAKGEHSAMDGVPLALPALLRARKLVSRAARAGLAEGARAGLAEGARAGLAEGARAGLAEGARAGLAEGARAGLAEGARAGLADFAAPEESSPTAQRIGEILFSAAALAERAGIDPEQALRDANAAYEARMRELEDRR